MSNEISYIHNEIEYLKNKRQRTEKLTLEEVTYLKWLEKALDFIKNCILSKLFNNIANSKMEGLQEYQLYLDQEIKKYTSRLTLLEEVRASQRVSKRTEAKINKIREKLESLKNDKESLNNDIEKLLIKYQPVGSFLKNLFGVFINGTNILNNTRLGVAGNDFLKYDENTQQPRLNRANVLLFLEVYMDHKLNNLRLLAKIGEINKNDNLAPEQKEAQKNSLLATLPENIQEAEIHVFDRFCYYNSIKMLSATPSSEINDEIYDVDETELNQIINYLRLALIIDSAYDFCENDLKAMLGEEQYLTQIADYESQWSEISIRKS